MPSDEGRLDPTAWARRGAPPELLALLESGLRPSELRSLLLEVASARASATRPVDVLARWRQDRFVRPPSVDPRRLAALECGLWAALPETFEGVELSPVTPLGTASALAPVSQRRVVSTMRLTEVVSDSTNALAVEAADRRTRQAAGGRVHLAAIQRQLRAQDFGPGASAHFRLMSLVSSARDTGSGRTEASLLVEHLRAWQALLASYAPDRSPRLHLTVWEDGVVAERVTDTILAAVEHDAVPVVLEPGRERGRGYYDGVALLVTLDDGATEIGDGGLTPWTARMMADRKERCLVSCVATERLLVRRPSGG